MRSKLMALAKAKKKSPKKTVTVEGEAARRRLDKPMRRADGGQISEDSKREAAKLREEANSDRVGGLSAAAAGLGTGILGSVLHKKLGLPAHSRGLERLHHAAGAGIGTAGLVTAGGAGSKERQASRIERGLVKEGEEDRAKGGRVKK